MRIGRYEIKADRWPWQPKKNHDFMARFGGGWQWKLGIDIGAGFFSREPSSVIINLLFGMIRISRKPFCETCGKPIFGRRALLRGEHHWECKQVESEERLEAAKAGRLSDYDRGWPF